MIMNIEDQIYTTIINEGLLQPDDDFAVGFSGGTDSSVLLHILARLKQREKTGWNITAAHFNHLLRSNADRDEAFCRKTAEGMGIPFVSDSFDVKVYAREHRMSTEAAARECRYRFFKSLGCSIVLAHQKNDNAETVLFNMVRGTGIRGITGMPICSDVYGVRIIRPMLGVKRSEIIEYAQKNSITFVQDETNRDTSFSRNRIRYEIMPMMESINPAAVDSIVTMAEHVKSGWDVISEKVTELEKAARIDPDHDKPENGSPGSFQRRAEALAKEADPGFHQGIFDTAILRSADRGVLDLFILRMLERTGARTDTQTVQRISDCIMLPDAGTLFLDAGMGACVYREYGRVVFSAESPERGSVHAEAEVDIPGEVRVPELKLFLKSRTVSVTEDLYGRILENRDRSTAYVDIRSVLGKRCVLRTWREGDRFRPLGVDGEKKLQDFFTDMKVPVYKRNKTGILEADGEIIWVVGMRISDRAKVRPDTEKAVKIEALHD